MSRTWVTIGALVVLTVLIRASGPLIMGTRKLPEGRRHHRSARTRSARRLVLTEAFAIGKSLTVDARAVGLGCAAVAMASRAPLLVVVVIAAAATAVTRAILA
jgi:hypothetical protein